MQINTERLKRSRFIDKCNLTNVFRNRWQEGCCTSPVTVTTNKNHEGKNRWIHNILNIYKLYKSVTKWHHTQITNNTCAGHKHWKRQMDTDPRFIQNLFAAYVFIKEESPSANTLPKSYRWHLFSFTSIWEHRSYRRSLWGSCTACRYARLCARRMAPPRHTVRIQARYIHERAFMSGGLTFMMKEQCFEVSQLGVYTWII